MFANALVFACRKSLRCRRQRVFALLMLSLWLLVNAQLALASHDCAPRPAALPVTIHHAPQMQHGSSMPTQAAAQGPLCEKHCVPDAAQKETQHSPLAALPGALDLTLTDWPAAPHIQRIAWLAPPIAGPPAEVRFCRYRE